MTGARQNNAKSICILIFGDPLGLHKFDVMFQKKITHTVDLCTSFSTKSMKIKLREFP